MKPSLVDIIYLGGGLTFIITMFIIGTIEFFVQITINYNDNLFNLILVYLMAAFYTYSSYRVLKLIIHNTK